MKQNLSRFIPKELSLFDLYDGFLENTHLQSCFYLTSELTEYKSPSLLDGYLSKTILQAVVTVGAKKKLGNKMSQWTLKSSNIFLGIWKAMCKPTAVCMPKAVHMFRKDLRRR